MPSVNDAESWSRHKNLYLADLLGKHSWWWLPAVPSPLLLRRGDQSSDHEVGLDAAGLPKQGRVEPDSV